MDFKIRDCHLGTEFCGKIHKAPDGIVGAVRTSRDHDLLCRLEYPRGLRECVVVGGALPSMDGASRSCLLLVGRNFLLPLRQALWTACTVPNCTSIAMSSQRSAHPVHVTRFLVSSGIAFHVLISIANLGQ